MIFAKLSPLDFLRIFAKLSVIGSTMKTIELAQRQSKLHMKLNALEFNDLKHEKSGGKLFFILFFFPAPCREINQCWMILV